jgi:hypothetical protein
MSESVPDAVQRELLRGGAPLIRDRHNAECWTVPGLQRIIPRSLSSGGAEPVIGPRFARTRWRRPVGSMLRCARDTW